MFRCEVIVQNKEGKLLTNQTTVIVDITIRKTTLVRAAEHLGVDYLFALRATLDFDHEVIRLCHPTSGLRSTIGLTYRDRDHRQVDSVCALITVPLGPYEQRRAPVRIPLDRVGRPGLLSQAGAVSMGSACVAHGYFGVVPATTSILIANPRSDHVIVRAGTRVSSIAPTHLDADVPLTIGAVCKQDNTSWVDFDNVVTYISPVLDTVATVRLAPADESTTPPTWKLQTSSETNSDLDEQQRTRLGEFILSAAIGSPDTTSIFSTKNDIGRANKRMSSHFHVIDTGDAGSRTGSYDPRRNPRSNTQIDKLIDDRLALDVIEPSRSPWHFPVVLTPKTDGSMGFRVHYRRLNEVTIPNAYRSPAKMTHWTLLRGLQYSLYSTLSTDFTNYPWIKPSVPKQPSRHVEVCISGLPFPLVFAMVPPHSSVFWTLFWQDLLLSAAFFTKMTLLSTANLLNNTWMRLIRYLPHFVTPALS
jgi:hypothetical protein